MTDDLQHILSSKRELLARGNAPRLAVNYTEGMSSDQKDRFIEYLIEQNESLKLDLRAMHAVLEDMKNELAKPNEALVSLQSEISSLRSELQQEREERKVLERENLRLAEKLAFANKNLFGSKSQKSRKSNKSKADATPDENPDADRSKNEDDFDGTPGSIQTEVNAQPEEMKPASKERDLSNRPETYSTMGVKNGNVRMHLTDRSKVPGRIIESDSRMIKVFSLEMCLVEHRFELVHYAEKGKKPKWGYFPMDNHPHLVTKLDGTKATPEFMQAIAYEVYVKNVTFGLLHQWLTDMGMTISRNTLHNWLKKGKAYLDELVKVLKEVALEKNSIVNCDETWCKVRKYDHYKKCYMWVLVNKAEKIVIFFYDNGSRGREVLTDFVGEAELKALMSDGYNAYTFIGDELKGNNLKYTVHLVCIAHLRAKLIKALEQGKDEHARLFLAIINRLYALERSYDAEGITVEERTLRRNSLETKSLLIDLRQHLDLELSRPEELRSGYLTEAINYLNHFWNELTAYVQDGAFPIDNNAAERAVRCMTTARNNSFHFGSDLGAQMSATYHSIISTVKLHGSSVWSYLGKFFTKIFEGCRDYSSLMPSCIGLK